MSPTDQYRLNSTDCLSLANKAGDSCKASQFIDMALYWFNMAEKVETGARIGVSDTRLVA
jgi:hypothetical protein